MTEVLTDALRFYRWAIEVKAQGDRLIVEKPNGSTREIISL